MHKANPSAAVLIAATVFPAMDAFAGDETSADVLAARVRNQGYLCEGVKSVRRERSEAVSDDAVWILTCENQTYRMILVPDMAARIEPLVDTSATRP